MGDFKDPTRLTRVAVVIVYFYMAASALAAVLLLAGFGAASSIVLRAGALFAIVEFFALLACYILVGRWIYRTNANAHLLSEEMTISPGWAVGWYFIPVANLWKPFQAMKESWLATHYSGNWHAEPVPSLLGWWWGLWLTTNFIGNISFQLSRVGGDSSLVIFLSVAQAALNVPLCVILIRLMRRLAHTQLLVHSAEAFT
jgi:hypothetical protein